jgi:organic hydroperoxide reductase OsmC/OhrA
VTKKLSWGVGKEHRYIVKVRWTGNRGKGTNGYSSYDRSHEIGAPSKQAISGSSDASFRGDRSRWNPEELLVASLSACHKLWYLHLCSEAGVNVQEYFDEATGTMEESEESGGRFTRVVLHPHVRLSEGSDRAKAHALHEAAHAKCFIANSVLFPVDCEPSFE